MDENNEGLAQVLKEMLMAVGLTYWDYVAGIPDLSVIKKFVKF